MTDTAWAYAAKQSAWTHRRKVVTGWIVGMMFGLGAAFAAWIITSDTATNGGRAKLGALTAPVFMAVEDAQVTDTLYAGETGDLTFKVDNGGTTPLRLTNLVQVAGDDFAVQSGAPSGTCSSASGGNFTFNPYSNATGVSVPVGITYVVVPNAVTVAANAENGCQGDIVTVRGLRATFTT